MHDIDRRNLLKGLGIGAGLIAIGEGVASCSRPGNSTNGPSTAGPSAHSKEPIKIGMILAQTGPLNLYGIEQVAAAKLAVEDLNRSGGIMGRKVQLLLRDSQSTVDQAVTYATQLITSDRVDVIMGGISSAQREAIRPVVDKNDMLYFYPALYEGGECDQHVFVRGLTPSQQLKTALIPWCRSNWGDKMYILAADYNFGHISAGWAKKYFEAVKGSVVGTEYIPLTSTDFSQTINHLSASNAKFIMSFLVGSNHLNFYRQLASAGLRTRFPIASTVFGIGNDQLSLSPAAGSGIVVALDYFQTLKNSANAELLRKWHAAYGTKYKVVSDYAVLVWDSIRMWAQAVEAAHTTERLAVTSVLENHFVYNSPAGRVTNAGSSNHFNVSVHLAKVDSHQGWSVFKTYPNVAPAYEVSVCNLKANPTTSKQFLPS